MRRHPFETSLDKVFDFSTKVGALPDGRQSPRHGGKNVFEAVFLGAACQFPALHRIETECQRGALSKRIGSLSEDAIGYALQRQDPRAVFALGCDLARQLKRNGIFRSDWSRGLVVAAVDGMEICSSFARSCDHCMERKVKHTVDGELREELQYYHRICAVTIVSSAFPIPLGMDTEVFQTITTDGHLKKPSVHQGRGQALIVLTMIRVLAFTLTLVFFPRQVRSHCRSCSIGFCDLAQRLAYQFIVTPQPDSS